MAKNIRVIATQRRNRRPTRRSYGIGNLPERYMQILSTILSSVSFILVASLAFYLHSNPTTFTKITTEMSKVPALKPAATYLNTHQNQTIGGMLLAGGISSSAYPSQVLGLTILGALLTLFILPKATFLEYFILSLATAVTLRVRNRNLRLLTIGVILVTIFIGWWGSSFLETSS